MRGEALFADLSRDGLLDLHRWMCLARAVEERLELLQKQGHIRGSIYRGLGQEAGAVGAAYALRRCSDGTGDVLAPTVRECGALLLFGASVEDFFRQYMARATAPTGGKEANVHWEDWERGIVGPVSPLGTMVEVVAGITFTFRLRGEDRVGMVFYGDGASSTGAWHEGLVTAAALRCPLLLMVEANQFAFSTPTRKNTRLESFAGKGPPYGIDAESVDGTDVLAVYQATRRASERARAGRGPQLIELRYFRRKGHAQHDAQEYVDPQELAEWERRDPLDTYADRLVSTGWATERELADHWRESEDHAARAAEVALAEAEPDGVDALLDVYTDVAARPPWTRLDPPDPARA